MVGQGTRSAAALDAVAPTAVTDWAKQLATGLRGGPRPVQRVVDRLRGR